MYKFDIVRILHLTVTVMVLILGIFFYRQQLQFNIQTQNEITNIEYTLIMKVPPHERSIRALTRDSLIAELKAINLERDYYSKQLYTYTSWTIAFVTLLFSLSVAIQFIRFKTSIEKLRNRYRKITKNTKAKFDDLYHEIYGVLANMTAIQANSFRQNSQPVGACFLMLTSLEFAIQSVQKKRDYENTEGVLNSRLKLVLKYMDEIEKTDHKKPIKLNQPDSKVVKRSLERINKCKLWRKNHVSIQELNSRASKLFEFYSPDTKSRKTPE